MKKNFYLNLPVNHQNSCVWATSHKADVDSSRLVVETGEGEVCASFHGIRGNLFWWYRPTEFCGRKSRVNADYYLTNLIPKLIEDAAALMPSSFIQQDGARSLPQAPEKAINDRGTSNHIAEDLVRVNDLPRKLVAKAVQNFRKRSQAWTDNAGGHFKHFIGHVQHCFSDCNLACEQLSKWTLSARNLSARLFF